MPMNISQILPPNREFKNKLHIFVAQQLYNCGPKIVSIYGIYNFSTFY